MIFVTFQSDESDSEFTEVVEDPSENPIIVGAKDGTNHMKLSPLKNMQNLPVGENQPSSQHEEESNEESNTKSDVRRSPRIASKVITSTNYQHEANNKGSKIVDTDSSDVPENNFSLGKGNETRRGHVNVSLENDLDLSSSESEAESMGSSTKSNQTSPRISLVNSCAKVLSPRRSRRLSNKSNDSDTGESPSREKNVRLTRSKRLSESSNDSTSGVSGDTEVRNTKSRKLSENQSPEILNVTGSDDKKADKSRSPGAGAVKISPRKVDSPRESESPCDNYQTGKNNSNETHTPGKGDTESSNPAQDINNFKEPFPISSPRTRKKAKSESVDNPCSDVRSEFLDKRVTRSTSCPEGVVNVNSKSPITRTRHLSSKCAFTEDQKSSKDIHIKPTCSDQHSENEQPEKVESSIQCETGPEKGVDNNKVPRTRSDADKSVSSKLERLPAADLGENGDQRQTETPGRTTRSQVKTVKSPEVIKREAGLEQIRLSRARKRSKHEESESDNDEEPIQKKLNKSRTLIESDSESEDNKDDIENLSTVTRSRSKILQDYKDDGPNELEQKSATGLKSLNQDEGKHSLLFVEYDSVGQEAFNLRSVSYLFGQMQLIC